MASTILDPVAEALKNVVDTVAGITAVKWQPKDIPVPAGVVGIPRGSRVGVDERESQLGSNDWNLTYEVGLFFDLSSAQFSQAQAVEKVEEFIAAVDNDPELSGEVLDAKVTGFEPEIVEDRNRPLLMYRCDVEVLKLVS